MNVLMKLAVCPKSGGFVNTGEDWDILQEGVVILMAEMEKMG